jgi:hypothetical protein
MTRMPPVFKREYGCRFCRFGRADAAGFQTRIRMPVLPIWTRGCRRFSNADTDAGFADLDADAAGFLNADTDAGLPIYDADAGFRTWMPGATLEMNKLG